jgi:predicted O-linked N-acetylglucosamine transferase (SPINDLY family)
MNFYDAVNYAIVNMKTIDRSLYDLGMKVFSTTQDTTEKENILQQLLMIYPKDAELYYKMALLFNGNGKSFLWHKLCYTIDPTHIENIITVIQELYTSGLHYRIFEYVDTTSVIYSKLCEDPRFLYIYSRCNFQELCYQNGVNQLLKLIQYYSKKPAITLDDKIIKWSNYHDLGYIYCAMGEIELAIKYVKKAVELADKFRFDLSRRLLSFNNYLAYMDYIYHDKTEVFQTFLKINEYLPEKVVHRNYKHRSKKIRIGYVSGDFTTHAIANFIIPILENHDRSQFEIVLYANQPEYSSDIFVKLNIPHRIIFNKPDSEIADLIYSEKIDILIDLNGHTASNRLGVFQYRPAPIQMSYLGYPNTTGLRSIKYRITDTIVDPMTTTQPYSEQLIRFNGCFLLYTPFHQKNPVKWKTAVHSEYIILGAINKENKNSKHALETWASILNQCPRAKILIKLETFDNTEERREFYTKILRTSSDRIIIVNKLSNEEYPHLFSKIDIVLDAFPYSGTTTTCNSLFNSIPVVTLYHENCHAHNVSSSILIHSGLSEFVAYSQKEYIDIVVDLVNAPDKLDYYKSIVRNHFLKLMEPTAFMKEYENALTTIYNNDILNNSADRKET